MIGRVKRPSPLLAALIPLLLSSFAAAQAPAVNWGVDRSPQDAPYAHTLHGTPDVTRFVLMCSTLGSPAIVLDLPRPPADAHISLMLTAPGGQLGVVDVGWQPIAGTNAWAAVLSDGAVVDMFAGPAAALEVSYNGRPNGRLSLAGSRPMIAEALAPCWQPRAAGAPAGEGGITIEIVLTPRAAAELQRRNEGITVATLFSGNPNRAHVRQVDELGMVDLGSHQVTVTGRAGTVIVPGTALNRQRLTWIVGQPEIHVSVISARRSSRDNLLACGLITGPLDQFAGRSNRVLCRLIEEPLA